MSSPPEYLRDLERLQTQLTRAGIAPFEAQSQFTSLSGSRNQMRKLQRLWSEVTACTTRMSELVGGGAGLPNTDDELVSMLADLAGVSDQTPKPLGDWLDYALRPLLPESLSRQAGSKVLGRIVPAMAASLRSHYDHVAKFVAAGFTSPLKSGVMANGFVEERQPFIGLPPPESVEWLKARGEVPTCITEWRAGLLCQYEAPRQDLTVLALNRISRVD